MLERRHQALIVIFRKMLGYRAKMISIRVGSTQFNSVQYCTECWEYHLDHEADANAT